jgi:hypothetical protein
MSHFKNCHLARMSDGHFCIIRDLEPVKGGKGLKHHEVVVPVHFIPAYTSLSTLRNGRYRTPRKTRFAAAR